jgi:hypothetical protein
MEIPIEVKYASIRGAAKACRFSGGFMKIPLPLALTMAAILQISSFAQTAPDWRDLADHMTGDWYLTGPVMGQEAHHKVHAEWVLNRQFLRIGESTAPDAPKAERRYDAIWFLGYDPVSERYVMHLLDAFGARFSETLGYGVRNGNQLQFVFEYPDGPFHTTLRWSQVNGKWEWMMEQKGKDGNWGQFADLVLTRPKSP